MKIRNLNVIVIVTGMMVAIAETEMFGNLNPAQVTATTSESASQPMITPPSTPPGTPTPSPKSKRFRNSQPSTTK